MTDATLRIDRWLFYCRFFKTRRLATEAVSAGHARVNGERATPGKSVRAGDVIELVRDRLPWRMTIQGIPVRRGPAAEARRCYEEDEQIVVQREQMCVAYRQDRLAMPRTEGRPDKHTRRLLRARNRDA
jgi:ribosome-associated heat shock protein Hsp15